MFLLINDSKVFSSLHGDVNPSLLQTADDQKANEEDFNSFIYQTLNKTV